ncbi:MAG: TIGR04222 domain-containing membrane protein [Negativicutes bacterium]
MYPYVMYLLYVGAVIGFCILLLRRDRRTESVSSIPAVLEIALLRGGLAAVVETLIFDLYVRKMIELKVDGADRKLRAAVILEQRPHLSELDESVIEAFTAVHGKLSQVKKARQQLTGCLRGTEEKMQKAGWWKTPARWHRFLPVLVVCLIMGGALRFFDYYEGILKWLLILTVPIWAIIGRHIVGRELSGPTNMGKELFERLRNQADNSPDPVWQVVLQGTQYLAEQPEYRVFYFMTRGVPYKDLQ